MRLRLAASILILTSALTAFAVKETLQELVARAEAAHLEDRPPLYIEAAERQLKSADELYTSGKVEDARAAVSDVVTFAQKATDASIQSHKRLKDTEIAIRKMAAKLRDIKRTLNFDDQPAVQDAADHLEKMRTGLLSQMFGKGK
jgi:hypothetical protein